MPLFKKPTLVAPNSKIQAQIVRHLSEDEGGFYIAEFYDDTGAKVFEVGVDPVAFPSDEERQAYLRIEAATQELNRARERRLAKS